MTLLNIIASIDPRRFLQKNETCRFQFLGKETWILESTEECMRLYRVSSKEYLNGMVNKISVEFPQSAEILSLIEELRNGFDAVLEWNVDISEERSVRCIVDAKNVDIKNASPDLTIRLDISTLQELLKEEINPQLAFLKGKIKITGNIALALKLISLRDIMASGFEKARL